MAKGVLRVRIVGDERELTSSLKRAHTEVGKFSGGVSGALKGLALLGGGAALVGGFKKAIDQTVQWGSEVKSLSRNLGVSAEQASALAVGAEHYGLGVDQLSKGLGIFEKHIVAGDKAAQSLGITFTNNKGQLLPFNSILERTSAVFQKLPDGPQKTALALNLFGRSGKELIPFLNAGPKAMREFSDEAKRLGLSLSGDNLRTITNYKFATRDFTASLHGLEVQIGLRVLPVLTTLAHVAAAGVELLGKIPTPVLGAAAAFGIFVGAVSLASRFAGAAQEVFGSLSSGLRDIFGGTEQASAGLRAQSAAATQGIAANTAAATAAGRLTLANDALAGATDQSSVATEIARVQTLKDATAQTIATAASARATVAAEAQAAANITLGESALAAAIGLQREAVAATEASAAYTGGGLRAALGGIISGLGSIISKVGPASIALGAVGGFLYFTARAAHAAANEAETFANAFAAAAGTGPTGIQKIKDEIGSLQLELNKAERLTGGRNLLQALTFWKSSDKDRLKAQIKDLNNILKDLGIQADATGAAGASALSKIEGSLDATGKFQANLKKLVAEGVPQKVADQLKTMGQDGQDAAQQLADGTADARTEFIKMVYDAGLVTPVLTKQDTALDKLSRQYRHASDAVDHFDTSLKFTLGGLLDVQDTTSRYNEDLEALGTSLKANGHTFDLNTQKGRDNSQALRTLVGDIESQIGALVRSGKVSGTDAAQKAVLLQKLHDLEVKFPALRGQIETYIGAVKKVPVEHITKIGIKTPSKAQIEKAAANVINHFDTRFDKEGGIPVSIKPQFTTPSLTVTATNVYLSSGGTRSAEGRIVRAPMFTQVGEGGHPEAIIPLDPAKKARRDQLLRESGLMKDILGRYGVKMADGAVVSGASGGSSIPTSLYSVASVRAPSRSATSVTYDDHSTVIVNNPVPERLSETLPALRRRKQLLRGH